MRDGVYIWQLNALALLHPRKIRLLARSLTMRKVVNLAKVFASFHYSRSRSKSFHRGNPVKIGFEPTTSCNLRCPECPSGLRNFTRPTGMAQMDLFRSVVDELHPDLIYLLLYFQGEPYLNPAFLDMAAYAVSKGIYTATSTNGHYLSDTNVEKTLDSGLSELIVSIDGATQKSYEAYRRGGSLDKVKAGLSRLLEAREKRGTLAPFVALQFLVVRPNEHEIPAIHALGRELGVDKVVLKSAQVYDFEQGNPLIPSNNKYSRYKQLPSGEWTIKNPLHNQCWKLWQGAEITWDGRVLPCCFDKDAQYEMGKLPESGFQEIWRNEAYNEFRNSLLRARSEIEMCKNCSEGTQVWVD